MPVTTRVFLDDLLLYGATASELGEEGEVCDVYLPAITDSVVRSIGQRCHLRLGYDNGDTWQFWYIMESIAEDLEQGGGVVRFLLQDM